MHFDLKSITDGAQLVHVSDVLAQVTQGAAHPVHCELLAFGYCPTVKQFEMHVGDDEL
jgi:hypothetical protein